MKHKKALSLILALVLAVGCMSITAFADGATTVTSQTKTWESGSYVVNGPTQISGTVTVNGNVTLNIASGGELQIEGTNGSECANGTDAIVISSGASLTITGEGSITVYGGNGGSGSGHDDPGGNGGDGIKIEENAVLTLNGGTLEATGGNGGDGQMNHDGDGDSGGKGGCGINALGTLTNSGATLIVKGGNGGNGGETMDLGTSVGGNGGNGGDGIYGSFVMDSGRLKAELGSLGTAASGGTGGKNGSRLNLSTYNITGGCFNIDISAIYVGNTEKNYVADGYECVTNTDSTTVTDYPMMVQAKPTTGTIDLDLEESTDKILDTKSIDQYYTKAEAGPDYVYNHKIQVTWSTAAMEIKVADAKKWSVSDLEWVTDSDTTKNGIATLVEDTNVKTFTLTNYSAKAFTCKLEFTAETDLAGKFTSYTVVDKDSTDVKNSGVTLANVVNSLDATETDKVYLSGGVVSYEKLPTATMTATVTPTLTGDGSFAGATAVTAAENAKYGTFKITCTAVNN